MLSTLSLLLVTTVLSVVMLLVLFSLRGSGVAGIREWAWGNALEAMALMLFASRGILPDIVSIEAANACYLGSIAMMYAGFRRHFGLPAPRRHLVAGVGAALAGVGLFHLLVDNLAIRAMLVSLFQCLLTVGIARTIPATRDLRLRYAYGFTRRAAWVLAVCHCARVLYFAPQVQAPLAFLDPSAWNLGFFAVGALALPALTLGAVMMANARVIRETAYDADHDHLTGAWSRRAFFRFAEREHARALRQEADLSLLVVDADHFKRINDTHGHAVGDRVLRDIVAHTQDVIRQIDYCARLGGEEFVVLLPDADAGTAGVVAERLRSALDRSLQLAPSTVNVAYTVSIGVATMEGAESLGELMARADAALYAAKAGGRNRVEFAAPSKAPVALRRPAARRKAGGG